MGSGNCMPSRNCCGPCGEKQDSFCGCGGTGGMIKITMEDGQELQCKMIKIFEVSETGYIALQQVTTNEIIIFRYIKDKNQTINLDNIKSDEEFELVSEALKGQLLQHKKTQ